MKLADRIDRAMNTRLDDMSPADMALVAAVMILTILAMIAVVALYLLCIQWAGHRWHKPGGFTVGIGVWVILAWALLRYALNHDDSSDGSG